MASLKFTLIIIAFIASSSSSSAKNRGNSVGNGGEVITHSERVWLRDFYDFGIDEPYLGPYETHDFEIEQRLENLQVSWKSDIPAAMLIAKVAELNNLRPRLGHYIISIWDFYSWRFTGDSLGSSDDDAPIRELPEGFFRKTVANRFGTTIQISQNLWQKMSAEQRMGLVIHEALYSILRKDCDFEGRCRQWAWKVRELTAGIFLPPSERAQGFANALANLPLPKILSEYHRPSISVTSEWGNTVLFGAEDVERRTLFFGSLCSKGKGEGEKTVNIFARRLPYRVFSSEYLTPANDLQMEVRIEARRSDLRFSRKITDHKECILILKKLFDLWYSPESDFEGEDVIPTYPKYEKIVRMLYLEILERETDPDGLRYYLRALENGRTEQELRKELLASPERQILLMYKYHFRRNPALQDVYRHLWEIAQGWTLEKIRRSLQESEECRMDCRRH